MNLGLIGDEAIHLTADMAWVEHKFLEILQRAKPKWLVTYDLPGTAELRKLTEKLNVVVDGDLWTVVQNPQNAPRRLVLIDGYYQPRWSEIALQDANLGAYSDYVVIFTNGQTHSFIDAHRQDKILEINYLEKQEKWLKYN